jgi:hypothetical protein
MVTVVVLRNLLVLEPRLLSKATSSLVRPSTISVLAVDVLDTVGRRNHCRCVLRIVSAADNAVFVGIAF